MPLHGEWYDVCVAAGCNDLDAIQRKGVNVVRRLYVSSPLPEITPSTSSNDGQKDWRASLEEVIFLSDWHPGRPLRTAAENGHVDILKYLVDIIRVNIDDVSGLCSRTALMGAAHHGQLCSVQYLIGKNANVNLCDVCGFSPILLACDRGHVNVVQHLVDDCGVPVDGEQKFYGTVMMYACQLGHLELVKFLIGRGASVNFTSSSKTRKSYSALAIAKESGKRDHARIVRLLTEHFEKDS